MQICGNLVNNKSFFPFFVSACYNYIKWDCILFFIHYVERNKQKKWLNSAINRKNGKKIWKNQKIFSFFLQNLKNELLNFVSPVIWYCYKKYNDKKNKEKTVIFSVFDGTK